MSTTIPYARVRKQLKKNQRMKDAIKTLRAVVDHSYDAMSIVNQHGVVVWVNRSYERITSLKYDEIVGRNMLELIERGYYDQSIAYKVFQSKRRETINQKIKKDKCVLLVTGTPIFDKDGQIEKVITNARDITEILNLQKQLDNSRQKAMRYQAELSQLQLSQQAGIVYRSPVMEKIIELARRVAPFDSTVLISGESGTGKELVASLIHNSGVGENRPFIKVNCAALPEHLLESELFGYEKGSFTGAGKTGKPGLFELAHQGTLFLDEIGDMPMALQVKLLRALQEKEIRRVGGIKTIKIAARIITATNRDLTQMVKQNKFRRDLYYRLMVVPINVPPLRERKEDISVLIKHFIDKYNKKFKSSKVLSPQANNALLAYSWPGNVRELENVIEHMMVTGSHQYLDYELIPETMRALGSGLPLSGHLRAQLDQYERSILATCFAHTGSWVKVAQELGINTATVYRKASRHRLLQS